MNIPVLSITDITSYLYCPRKFYLKKVRGIKEKPNQAMIKGRLKHEILDIFNKMKKIL
jgi:CRISPR/Cas system-associated exonuclease Cas4 (RecB family)